MTKTNNQVQAEILKQLKDETFTIYSIENGNFFNECYDFLEKNKLKIVPIFSDFSYTLSIVKEDCSFDASSILSKNEKDYLNTLKKDRAMLDQVVINTRPKVKLKIV